MWRYSQAPGAAAAGARSLDCGGSRCASTAVAAAAPQQAPLVLGVASRRARRRCWVCTPLLSTRVLPCRAVLQEHELSILSVISEADVGQDAADQVGLLVSRNQQV